MIDLKLFNEDLVFVDGDLALVSDGEETAQNFTIRMKTRQGEWKQNVLEGLDMLQLFSSATSMAHKEALIRDVVYSTPGVKDIHKMEVYKDQKEMRLLIDLEVSTIYATNELLSIVL